MGVSTKIHCNNCGYDFTREYGVGIDGHAVLYCDRCGKPTSVDFSGGWVTTPKAAARIVARMTSTKSDGEKRNVPSVAEIKLPHD